MGHMQPRRVIDPQAGPRNLTELLGRPGVVEECVLRSTFGMMAIHGGGLEMMTDVIAATAADLAGASYYAVVHPNDVDHHLSSLQYRPEESTALASFVDHVEVVVSIHGYGREGSWMSILAGGRNRRLAMRFAAEAAIRLPDYEVITELARIPVELRGLERVEPGEPAARAGRPARAATTCPWAQSVEPATWQRRVLATDAGGHRLACQSRDPLGRRSLIRAPTKSGYDIRL